LPLTKQLAETVIPSPSRYGHWLANSLAERMLGKRRASVGSPTSTARAPVACTPASTAS
jgi:hypothetical protein